MRTLLALAATGFLAASIPVDASAGKDKDKLVVTPGETKDGVETLTCAPKGRALLRMPTGLDPATKPGLLVALHGDGSRADGMTFQELSERRKWAVLAVEGRIDVQTPQGPGHRWEMSDAAYIAGLAKWCVQNRGIDPKAVVLFGHSAGGIMAFASYPADPGLFAGVITCSAPGAPDKRHETTRCVVFLGSKDQNIVDAKVVQNQMEKKEGAARLALTIMDDAEHNDLPETPYLDAALDWVLAKGAVGRESHVPKKPPEAPAAGLRHVLFRWKGAAGASADVKRSKEAAKKEADELLKRVRAGKASFVMEAQALSEDVESRPLGGAISAEKLAAFGGAAAGEIPKGADKWAGPFESPAGWHVVERAP